LDPRTDVNRAMKMLAVLQALHFVQSPATADVARRLYQMSLLFPSATTQGRDLSWPFMCVSIMFTKEALQALRAGALNKAANKVGDVLAPLHDYHAACFVDFGKRMVATPMTHHAVHLGAVRDTSKVTHA
jgi:hypothetical protein